MSAQKQLVDLLVTCSEWHTFYYFVKHEVEDKAVILQASLQMQPIVGFNTLVDALDRRRLLNGQFFRRLAEVYPTYTSEIVAVADRWGVYLQPNSRSTHGAPTARKSPHDRGGPRRGQGGNKGPLKHQETGKNGFLLALGALAITGGAAIAMGTSLDSEKRREIEALEEEVRNWKRKVLSGATRQRLGKVLDRLGHCVPPSREARVELVIENLKWNYGLLNELYKARHLRALGEREFSEDWTDLTKEEMILMLVGEEQDEDACDLPMQ